MLDQLIRDTLAFLGRGTVNYVKGVIELPSILSCEQLEEFILWCQLNISIYIFGLVLDCFLVLLTFYEIQCPVKVMFHYLLQLLMADELLMSSLILFIGLREIKAICLIFHSFKLKGRWCRHVFDLIVVFVHVNRILHLYAHLFLFFLILS